jgi:hypothetical protein
MTDLLVRQLLALLEESFEGDAEHSLMANLRAVDASLWHQYPPGGGRTAAGIAWHAGAADFIYANHAFGDGSMRWGVGPLADRSATLPRAEMLDWVGGGYAAFRGGLSLLADAALGDERAVHYGGMLRTDRIVFMMVEHHAYHAGEVNHLRAMLTGTDRWPGG